MKKILLAILILFAFSKEGKGQIDPLPADFPDFLAISCHDLMDYFSLSPVQRVDTMEKYTKIGGNFYSFFFLARDIQSLVGDTCSLNSLVSGPEYSGEITHVNEKALKKVFRGWRKSLKKEKYSKQIRKAWPPDYEVAQRSWDTLEFFMESYVTNCLSNRVKYFEEHLDELTKEEIKIICADINAITNCKTLPFDPYLNRIIIDSTQLIDCEKCWEAKVKKLETAFYSEIIFENGVCEIYLREED